LPYALDRVEQLLLKTNQFKLNNTVYNKKQIEINHNKILAMRFLDKLNDYGIVVILLLDFRDKKINIINWVMSCRVFSRNIELAVLEILKKIAYNKSSKIISLEFIKSKKNITAERVISKLGFKKNNNTTVYDLNVDDIAVNSNIKVKFLERFDK
jgi:FkbH-like protein